MRESRAARLLLDAAAMNGHVPAVKLLLDMGSDINAQIETNRNTALTLACFQGRAEVVSLLLDRRANVEHRAKVSFKSLVSPQYHSLSPLGLFYSVPSLPCALKSSVV